MGYSSSKVILIKSFYGLFLWNRNWKLGWFEPVGPFRVHELLGIILWNIKLLLGKNNVVNQIEWFCFIIFQRFWNYKSVFVQICVLCSQQDLYVISFEIQKLHRYSIENDLYFISSNWLLCCDGAIVIAVSCWMLFFWTILCEVCRR